MVISSYEDAMSAGITLKVFATTDQRPTFAPVPEPGQIGEIILDEKCTACNGLGYREHNGTCPECEGTGFIPTEDGLQLLQFMRRHAAAAKVEES